MGNYRMSVHVLIGMRAADRLCAFVESINDVHELCRSSRVISYSRATRICMCGWISVFENQLKRMPVCLCATVSARCVHTPQIHICSRPQWHPIRLIYIVVNFVPKLIYHAARCNTQLIAGVENN